MWNLHVVLKVTRSKLSFASSKDNRCLFVKCQSLESCWVICFFHFNSEKVSLCNIWIQDSGFRIQEVCCPVYGGNTVVASPNEILTLVHSLHTTELKRV